jgi:hypothetical protein
LRAGHAFPDRAQDFRALSDAKKDWPRDKRDDKAEATRFELTVKTANDPPDALKPVAALISFSIYGEGLLMRRKLGKAIS